MESNWRRNVVELGMTSSVFEDPGTFPPPKYAAQLLGTFPVLWVVDVPAFTAANAWWVGARADGLYVALFSVPKPNGPQSRFPYGFPVVQDHP